ATLTAAPKRAESTRESIFVVCSLKSFRCTFTVFVAFKPSREERLKLVSVTPISFSRACTGGLSIVATAASCRLLDYRLGRVLGQEEAIPVIGFEIDEALLVGRSQCRQHRRTTARQDGDAGTSSPRR